MCGAQNEQKHRGEGQNSEGSPLTAVLGTFWLELAFGGSRMPCESLLTRSAVCPAGVGGKGLHAGVVECVEHWAG